MNGIIRFIKGIILIVAVVALGVIVKDYIKSYYDAYKYELEGMETTDGEDVVVTIPEGASAQEVANILIEKAKVDVITYHQNQSFSYCTNI